MSLLIVTIPHFLLFFSSLLKEILSFHFHRRFCQGKNSRFLISKSEFVLTVVCNSMEWEMLAQRDHGMAPHSWVPFSSKYICICKKKHYSHSCYYEYCLWTLRAVEIFLHFVIFILRNRQLLKNSIEAFNFSIQGHTTLHRPTLITKFSCLFLLSIGEFRHMLPCLTYLTKSYQHMIHA